MIKKILKKRRLRLVLGILAGTLVVIIAVSLIIHSPFFKNFLVKKAAGFLEKRYGLSVGIDSFDFSPMRLSLSLRGITLKPLVERDSFLKGAFIKELSIDLPLKALVSGLTSGSIHVQTVRVSEPRLIIGEGKKRAAEPPSSSGKVPAKGVHRRKPVDIRIGALDLSAGVLEYDGADYGFSGSLQKIRAEVRYSAKDGRHFGELKAEGGGIRTSRVSLPLQSVFLGFNFDSRKVEVSHFSLNLPKTTLELSGWAEDYQAVPRFSFDLAGTVDIEEIASLFTPLESPAACSGDEDIIPFRANTGFNAPCEPPRWKVEDFLTGFTVESGHKGSLRLAASIHGGWEKFILSGELGGKNLWLRDVSIPEIQAVFSADEKSLSVTGFQADLAGGRLAGRLEIDYSPQPSYSLSLGWDSLDLERLTDAFPGFPLLISSRADGKLDLRGRGADFSLMEASGALSFSPGKNGRGTKPQKKRLQGKIYFQASGGVLRVDDSFLSLDTDSVAFSGSLDKGGNFKTRFSLRLDDLSSTADLFHHLNQRVKSLGFPGNKLLGANGQVGLTGVLEGNPNRWKGAINLEGQKITFNRLGLKKVSGCVESDGGEVAFRMSAAGFRVDREEFPLIEVEGRYGKNQVRLERLLVTKGEGVLSGALSLGLLHKDYSIVLTGKGFDLAAFESLKSIGVAPEGRAVLSLDGRGTLDSPQFAFRLSAEKVAAFGRDAGDVSLRVDSDGGLITAEFDIPEWAISLKAGLKLEKPYTIRGELQAPNFALDRLFSRKDAEASFPISGGLAAEASFSVPLDDWKNMQGIVRLEKLWLDHQELGIRNSSPLSFTIKDGEIGIESFSLSGTGAEFSASGIIPLFDGDTGRRVQVEGRVNLKMLAPLLPESRMEGILSLKSNIGGSVRLPRLNAEVTLEQGVFFHPLFPYRLHEAALVLKVEDNMAAVKASALAGDAGRILAQGSLSLAPYLSAGKRHVLHSRKEAEDGDFDLMVEVAGLDLSPLSKLRKSDTRMEFGGLVEGTIRLTGNPADLDRLEVEGNIHRLLLSLSRLSLKNDKTISFRLKDNTFHLERMRFLGDKIEVEVSGTVMNPVKNPEVNALVSARAEASSLAPLLGNVEMEGVATLEAQVRGPLLNPIIEGKGVIKDGFFRMKEYQLVVSNFSGTVLFSPPSAVHFGFSGSANGGPLKVEGRVSYHELSRIDSAAVKLTCENFLWNYPQGLSLRSNIALQLEREEKAWLLLGEVKLVDGYYRKDIHPGTQLLNVAFSRAYRTRMEVSPFLQNVRLDIGLSTQNPFIVDNNLADLEMTGNLRITGSALAPAISGRVENRGIGEVVFGDRRYKVERANADFLGTETIDPWVEVLARTQLAHKQDRLDITLSLSGSLSRLSYSLSSFPPRSQEDLALLLLTGRSLDEIKGAAVNTLGSRMILHFAFPMASPVTERIKQILKAEDVSLEPLNIAGEEDPGARFTFRKRVSTKAAVTYSIDITDSQRQTWMVDYDLSRNFSISSFRKDDGSYGSSFKHSFSLGAGRMGVKRPDAGAGAILKSVRVEGELGLLRDVVEKQARALKQGSSFDYSGLDRVVERLIGLYKRNGYLNVVVSPRIQYEDGGNVHVSLHVSAGNPVSLEFKGDPVSGRIKKKIVADWSGRIPWEMALDEAGSLITNDLHGKGYYAAVVSAVRRSEDQKTVLSFSVEKGRRYRIRSLTLRGNTSLSPGLIRKAVTRFPSERGKGLWVLVHDTSRALAAVRRLYEENGFLRAAVGPSEVIPDHKTGWIDIKLTIEEGPKSRVGGLEFIGNKAIEEKELRSRLKLVEGSVFNPRLQADDINELLSHYQSRGYRDAEVSGEVVQDREGLFPVLVYRIHEGVEHRVAEVVMEGDAGASESLVRREMTLREGDVLTLSALSLSQKRLYDTGIFRTVNVQAQPGEEGGKDRVMVDAVRRPRLTATYGLRYNSEEKLEGFGELLFTNLMGGGRNGLLFYRQNNRRKDCRFSLKDPFLFGARLNSLYSVYYNNEVRASYVTDEIGFTFQQEVRLPADFTLSYLYRLNRIHTYEAVPSGPFAFDISLFLSELSFSLVRDTRDDKLDAGRGTSFFLNFSYSPEFLGSELTYVRFFSQYSLYKPLMPELVPGLVWASSIRLGLADAFDQVLIPYKRFFAGGVNSIRGFKQDMVGPYDSYLERPEGGEAVFILNQELRFPIFQRLKGVVFFDMGNVYSRLEDLSLRDVRQSAGLGVRYKSPVGLIRVDYGFNLKRRPGEPGGALFLSIGQAF